MISHATTICYSTPQCPAMGFASLPRWLRSCAASRSPWRGGRAAARCGGNIGGTMGLLSHKMWKVHGEIRSEHDICIMYIYICILYIYIHINNGGFSTSIYVCLREVPIREFMGNPLFGPWIGEVSSQLSGGITRPGKPWENHGKKVIYMENHHFLMGKSTINGHFQKLC